MFWVKKRIYEPLYPVWLLRLLCLLKFITKEETAQANENHNKKRRISTMAKVPAARASLHASYMSCFISGLSSAIASPTVTKRSTAKLTAWPTRPMARNVLSDDNCPRSERWCAKVEIYSMKKKEEVKRIYIKWMLDTWFLISMRELK